MNTPERIVLVAALAEQLRKRGSWCGETHLQKSLFLLQEMLKVPLEFEFVLYKHGPYSFDLRDHLTMMRADGYLDVEPQPFPYGPRLSPSNISSELRKRFPQTEQRYSKQIEFVASAVGTSGVAELERLATALYVTAKHSGPKGSDGREKDLRALKPHVSLEEARGAVRRIDELIVSSELMS